MNDRLNTDATLGEPAAYADLPDSLRYNPRHTEAGPAVRGESVVKTVAEFQIQYRQILDPTGHVRGELPAFAQDDSEMLKMFGAMLRARIFDAKAVNLQRTGKLGTYAPCLGQEATHVGVGAALRPEDSVAIVYREIGTLFWRGVRMVDVLLYWGGDERGNDFAGPAHDFPWCVPIATQTLHAAGAAMAFKIRKEPRCALAYIGDGGTSEGTFYEAINLAGAKHLPIVFVIVNNKWAISVPVEEQTAAQTLAQKAIAAGIPGVQVDGNDIIAVRDTVEQALAKGNATGRRPDGDRSAELPPERSHHRRRRIALSSQGRSRGSLEARAARAHARIPSGARRARRGARTSAQSRVHRRSGSGSQGVPEHPEAVDRFHVRLPLRESAALHRATEADRQTLCGHWTAVALIRL